MIVMVLTDQMSYGRKAFMGMSISAPPAVTGVGTGIQTALRTGKTHICPQVTKND